MVSFLLLASRFEPAVGRPLLFSSNALPSDLDLYGVIRDRRRLLFCSMGRQFRRYRAREFSRYLTIALASLGEATLWLRDGVDRGHFPEGACDAALALARRCHIATVRLKHSLDATLPG